MPSAVFGLDDKLAIEINSKRQTKHWSDSVINYCQYLILLITHEHEHWMPIL